MLCTADLHTQRALAQQRDIGQVLFAHTRFLMHPRGQEFHLLTAAMRYYAGVVQLEDDIPANGTNIH